MKAIQERDNALQANKSVFALILQSNPTGEIRRACTDSIDRIELAMATKPSIDCPGCDKALFRDGDSYFCKDGKCPFDDVIDL